MLASGDILIDEGCSASVRMAVQALLRSAPLTVCNIGELISSTPVALARTRVVLLALRNRRGMPTIGVIERLRLIAPHVGVFVVEDKRDALDSWLPRLAAAGADDAFALDRIADEKVLHMVLANRVALAPPELAVRELQWLWRISPVMHEGLYCVRNGCRPRRRFDPYVWLGPQPKSVRTRFDRAGLPTPLWLTRFGRELYWRENIAAFRHRRLELAWLLGFDTVEQVGIERRRLRKAAERYQDLLALLREAQTNQDGSERLSGGSDWS